MTVFDLQEFLISNDGAEVMIVDSALDDDVGAIYTTKYAIF